jgi:hypothetical protein
MTDEEICTLPTHTASMAQADVRHGRAAPAERQHLCDINADLRGHVAGLPTADFGTEPLKIAAGRLQQSVFRRISPALSKLQFGS